MSVYVRAVLACVMVGLPACGSGADPVGGVPESVPADFRPACGKPDSVVTLVSGVGTIKRSECDLTGVMIRRQDGGGALVPPPGEAVSNSLGVHVTVAPNGDVAYRVYGPST